MRQALGRISLNSTKILPPARIGIIGGGQLALYMAIEAIKMGYSVSSYDPNPQSPAKRVSDFTCASFDDLEALKTFASQCDVLTYEFENMNLEHIEYLNEHYNLPQGSSILKKTAHRYEEIKFAQSLGIPTIPSVYLENQDSDQSEVAKLNFPVILKTARFGYDGKGQRVIQQLKTIDIEVESLVSEFITFDYEISIIIACSGKNIEVYPAFKNKHKKGVLHYTHAQIDHQFSEGVVYATKIAEAVDYQGLLAVEFFVKDGQLIFNEVAPRPHNSGHITLSISNKSQFKAHIESICNLEVGPLFHYEDGLMVNLLGDEVLESRNHMGEMDFEHFEYGKKDIVEGRKMGHDVYTNDAMNKKLRELANE